MYRVVSANGAVSKEYTVNVLEVNTRIYVDADATGDNTGVSWSNAFKSLMDACAAPEHLPATLSAEIWIAEGTYRPSETRDKAAYFRVRGNTGYYGGFAGNETAKTQRVPDAHPVVITGELGGGVYAEHLFMNTDLQNRNAAFDWLKFTKARALTEDYLYMRGPAIYIRSANTVTVSNSVFEDFRCNNSGSNGFGGAVAIFSYSSNAGSVFVSGCDFENTESSGTGGALYATALSVSISNCGFKNTQSRSGGGAVTVTSGPDGSVSITGCTFENSRVINGNAGALSVSGNSVNINNCDFKNTQASSTQWGGPLGGAVSVTGTTININGYTSNVTSAEDGGSLYIVVAEGGAASVRNAVITNSKAANAHIGNYDDGGGGIYITGGSSTRPAIADFSNITFGTVRAEGSSGFTHGGAIIINRYINLTMTNCAINNASSSKYGGAIGGFGKSSCVLNGVSFTGCTAPQGNILYGNQYTDAPGVGPIYTVGSGCSVDGTPISSAADLDTVLPSPSVRYLVNGATITFAP
jgi:hypothetical protein